MTKEDKKLERPRRGRMLAGVCAAFAKYFEVDVTIVRLIYAVLTVCTAFCGVIVYFIAAFIIPQEKDRFLE